MANITAAGMTAPVEVSPAELRKVVFASSLGTVFEWYDFYLYAVLAPFFAGLFFPPGNNTAALLSAFATYAAGFLVRPFGAVFFGRIGDIVGRKYTFLLTITLMGLSTVATGLIPAYSTIGVWAPAMLVVLRLVQGLALGGEYGGAATYVAEHSPTNCRGYATSWIQTTATGGLLLALIVIALMRSSVFAGDWPLGYSYTPETDFKLWGWRIPFLISFFLLIISVYVRISLSESPLFKRLKEEGRGSKAPLYDSFMRYPNNRYVMLALLGATAGQGVVWYTGQFYALFFLSMYLQLDYLTTYELIGISLVIGTPFFVFFGWLSDRIGRLKIILGGCLIAALTYFHLFAALADAINPALVEFQEKNPIVLSADRATCQFHVFPTEFTVFSDCDKAQDQLTKAGLSFEKKPLERGQPVSMTIGSGAAVEGYDAQVWSEALKAAGYPATLDRSRISYAKAIAILALMVLYVTMVYGPMAAFLVELFPTKIRYTSVSLPYHIGNGWFGGLLPWLATALVAANGNIYYGLWYPVIVAMMTAVIGFLFLRETKGRELRQE
jgi:MFS family permease